MTCSLTGNYAEVQYHANLVRASEHLYDYAISAVQMNVNMGEWFSKTELVNDVFFQPHSSTVLSKGFCLMLWKNMMKSLA